jgi:hypothetical protein
MIHEDGLSGVPLDIYYLRFRLTTFVAAGWVSDVSIAVEHSAQI